MLSQNKFIILFINKFNIGNNAFTIKYTFEGWVNLNMTKIAQ